MRVAKMTLYRYRFYIGYVLLAISFLSLMLILPQLVPNGIHTTEMESVIKSHNPFSSPVNFFYNLLQFGFVKIFGLSDYVIKIPSVLIGIALCIFLVLLLNRWFKSNVALLTSILMVLSVLFLYVSSSGTPIIMYLFWPTVLLWFGSRINGEVSPSKKDIAWFFVLSLMSLLTPYMVYFLLGVIIIILLQPHLRHVVKKMSWQMKVGGVVMLGLAAAYLIWLGWDNLRELLIPAENKTQIFNGLNGVMITFFGWSGKNEGVILAPLVGLGTFALAFVGLASNIKHLFSNLNLVATMLAMFVFLVMLIDVDFAVALMLPIAILVAQGLKYVFEKWYSLFPENPYARIFALLPITIILMTIIVSDLSHYVFSYRYNPVVANEFSTDLKLLRREIKSEEKTILVVEKKNYEFYKILEEKMKNLEVVKDLKELQKGTVVMSLKKMEKLEKDFNLNKIITSPKSSDSDRIYVYKIN